ncbi:MAG: histidinol dehydrogenase [Bacillota bacterium]|nr:histidinol dehydrogenase [Bacillota bacterium]
MKRIKSNEFSMAGTITNKFDFGIRSLVTEILLNVSKKGDAAISYYTNKFDNVVLDNFKVNKNEIEESYKNVDEKFIKIIKKAIENIFIYHKKQNIEEFSYETLNNSLIGQKVTPLNRIAIYIPGGKANYPSSVLMNVIPAIVAGVKEIVLISPPNKEKKINAEVLVCADILGVKEIYKIGGVQGVGAVAYGTESIKKVDKIVGPGNKYVAEAKRQVFGLVDIDMIAGPSEILIIADKYANARYIARDLLSQAEHDENAKCYLLTTSEKIISETKKLIKLYIEQSNRKNIISKAIENLLIIKSNTIDEMINLSNEIAPEHLEILIKDPESILDLIINAGSIFLGEYSPEPVGDYFAGPNHTLPTNQTAKFFSPLGVYDFLKRSSYIKYSKKDLIENYKEISYFAIKENLMEHSESLLERFKYE